MVSGPQISPAPDDVRSTAADLLGTHIAEAEPLPVSYGNIAWRRLPPHSDHSSLPRDRCAARRRAGASR
jgi:hypothetical protein